MSERRLYVYRLNVEIPPDRADGTGWEPDDWNEGIDPSVGASFQWPRATHYLSLSGANRRAALFRKYGATVDVVRSKPVEWP